MLEHFRKFGKFGLLLATMLLPMLTSVQGNAVDLDDLANGGKFDVNIFISDSSRSKFKKRLRDVIFDMVRLEYI